MMVPMLHTNGITAYAFATQLSAYAIQWRVVSLTLVRRIHDELANHGLDDANIAIEHTADKATCKGNPESGCKTDD